MKMPDWLRRLLGRKPKASPAPPARAAANKEPMHWRPGAYGAPVCGATEWRLWTIEPAWVTCAACQDKVDTIEMKRALNTR